MTTHAIRDSPQLLFLATEDGVFVHRTTIAWMGVFGTTPQHASITMPKVNWTRAMKWFAKADPARPPKSHAIAMYTPNRFIFSLNVSAVGAFVD
jgi:hypothetical protein